MASPGELHRGAAAWLCTLERGWWRLQLIAGELSLQKQQGMEVDRGAISLPVWLAGSSQDVLAIIWELEEGPAAQLDPIIDWSQADELLNICYALFEEGVALRTELEDSIGYLGGTCIIDDDYKIATNNNNNNNNSNNGNDFCGCKDCTECTDEGKSGGREDSIGGTSGTCIIAEDNSTDHTNIDNSNNEDYNNNNINNTHSTLSPRVARTELSPPPCSPFCWEGGRLHPV
ncbi:hypothetical protein CBR_g18673 [Chara braunii]|uniref:Uncharacterized protein n=1 Tax=Chara braunii TaxID=69332 RepID=A0A388KWA1_CHABU|nr:hypothetical protein CBR_g18673 [Chara braunii]|eukprot:GBG74262.1 hypothetical protein CBR_g18673 [Chara braunii]